VREHLTPETVKPLTAGDLASTLEIDHAKLLQFLEGSARRGQLIRVAANRFFHPAAVVRLAAVAEELSRQAGDTGFDARSYRDASGIGRNLTIDVLEFFDVMGLTRRQGETRSAVRSREQIFGGDES
jgi:selenocysteine-specific elongation factor